MWADSPEALHGEFRDVNVVEYRQGIHRRTYIYSSLARITYSTS
jgi:hypothetical protein